MFAIQKTSGAVLRSSVRTVTASSVKHNSTSTMHDNDPDTLEVEKNRNLSNSQHKTSTPHKHAPGWNEHLASASEANVKADKSTGTTTELQSETVKYVRSRHPDTENGAQSTTAFYARDEVMGPLSGALGKEEEVTIHKRRVTEDITVDDVLTEDIEDATKMTPSEEDVKADRGEI